MSMFESYDNIPGNYIPNNTTFHSKKYVKFDEFPPYKRFINNKFLGYYWYEKDQFTFKIRANSIIKVDPDSIIISNGEQSKGIIPVDDEVLELAPEAYTVDCDDVEDLIQLDQSLPQELTKTVGILGQKAYDITNLISWTCTTTINGKLNWVRDRFFMYPIDGRKIVPLTNVNWNSSSVKLDIENFRREVIFSSEYSAYQEEISDEPDIYRVSPNTTNQCLRFVMVENDVNKIPSNYIEISVNEELSDLLTQGQYYFKITIKQYINKNQSFLLSKEFPVSILGSVQKEEGKKCFEQRLK